MKKIPDSRKLSMLRARDVLLRNGFSKREISKVLQASYTTLYRWEKELANK